MFDLILAISVLVGTIIGAGIFVLPYAAFQSGFIIFGVQLAILFIVILFLHLFYGEIVLKTPGKHRLVGYVEKYLGKNFKTLASVVSISGFYGTLLVFLSLGGYFTNILFKNFFSIDNFFLSALFFYFLGCLFLLLKIRFLAKIELILSTILLGIILTISAILADKISPQNLLSLNFKNMFLPYGIIMFALSGASAIPEIKEFIKKDFFKIIFWGTFIPAVSYFLYALSVAGALGKETTKDSIGGLAEKFGDGIISLMTVFGIASIFSSFITIGDNLKKVFWYDFKLPHFLSWFLVIIVPLILFLFKFYEFVFIMALVGALSLGAEGILIILVHNKIQKLNPNLLEKGAEVPWSGFLRPVVLLLLILGALLSLFY